MAALATYELTKDYAVGFWRKRPYRALDRLTLEIEPGEVFGFLGPNGAGKTTALKLLMQLVFPTSGRIEILGRPAGDLRLKRRIGFLPENPYFYDHLTAEELLTYFAALFGYRRADSRARASRLLDEVGIGGERRLQLRKFSKGMLQRVGIAQALLNDPDLVIFDEPMSGLDPIGRRDVRALILRLRDRGCTVFFSSHVLSDAEALCSRVAILAQGRLVAAGRLSEMVSLDAHGWELVVSSVSDSILPRVGPRVRRIVRISEGHYAIELPLDPAPELILAELTAAGARLVSLNPIRDTLEDIFVRRVAAAAARAEAAAEGESLRSSPRSSAPGGGAPGALKNDSRPRLTPSSSEAVPASDSLEPLRGADAPSNRDVGGVPGGAQSARAAATPEAESLRSRPRSSEGDAASGGGAPREYKK